MNLIKTTIKQAIIREKLSELAIKYPDGVNFSEQGFPDFGPYVLKQDGKKIEVDIKRLNPGKSGLDKDFVDATKEMRKIYPNWKQPMESVWHHVEYSTKLQLLPEDIHQAVGHFGGRETYNF